MRFVALKKAASCLLGSKKVASADDDDDDDDVADATGMRRRRRKRKVKTAPLHVPPAAAAAAPIRVDVCIPADGYHQASASIASSSAYLFFLSQLRSFLHFNLPNRN